MKTYRVISKPYYTWNGGRTDDSSFHVGDIVRADLEDADSDGDVLVRHLDAEWQGDRLNPSCLKEVDHAGRPVAPRNDPDTVSVRALRAALSLGEASGKDIDDLVRVVQLLDAAYPA